MSKNHDDWDVNVTAYNTESGTNTRVCKLESGNRKGEKNKFNVPANEISDFTPDLTSYRGNATVNISLTVKLNNELKVNDKIRLFMTSEMDVTNADFFIDETRINPVDEGTTFVLTKDYEKRSNFTITISDAKLPPPTLFNDIDGNLQLNSFPLMQACFTGRSTLGF